MCFYFLDYTYQHFGNLSVLPPPAPYITSDSIQFNVFLLTHYSLHINANRMENTGGPENISSASHLLNLSDCQNLQRQ